MELILAPPRSLPVDYFLPARCGAPVCAPSRDVEGEGCSTPETLEALQLCLEEVAEHNTITVL